MCRAMDKGEWQGDDPNARESVLPASEALYAAWFIEVTAAVPLWCACPPWQQESIMTCSLLRDLPCHLVRVVTDSDTP
jgi:hypothetical protein